MIRCAGENSSSLYECILVIEFIMNVKQIDLDLLWYLLN